MLLKEQITLTKNKGITPIVHGAMPQTLPASVKKTVQTQNLLYNGTNRKFR